MGRAYGEAQSWAFCTTSYDGVGTPVSAANAANAPGVSFQANGANSDGTPVTVLSALGHDVHLLQIAVGGLSLGSGQSACLGDLLVDPAGGTSWSSIWEDMVVGHSPVVSGANGLFSRRFAVNLFVKAGSSIGFRARTRNASNFADGRIAIMAKGEPSNPDQWWCSERIETLGNIPAGSNGTLITPGNTGAMGSWTSVGSTTTGRYGAIMLAVQGDNIAALNATGFFFEIGHGSAKLPGTPLMYVASTTAETVFGDGGFSDEFHGCDIPAGTQMQVRASQTASASVTPGVCLYGAVR